jgi:hypothetical protein
VKLHRVFQGISHGAGTCEHAHFASPPRLVHPLVTDDYIENYRYGKGRKDRQASDEIKDSRSSFDRQTMRDASQDLTDVSRILKRGTVDEAHYDLSEHRGVWVFSPTYPKLENKCNRRPKLGTFGLPTWRNIAFLPPVKVIPIHVMAVWVGKPWVLGARHSTWSDSRVFR